MVGHVANTVQLFMEFCLAKQGPDIWPQKPRTSLPPCTERGGGVVKSVAGGSASGDGVGHRAKLKGFVNHGLLQNDFRAFFRNREATKKTPHPVWVNAPRPFNIEVAVFLAFPAWDGDQCRLGHRHQALLARRVGRTNDAANKISATFVSVSFLRHPSWKPVSFWERKTPSWNFMQRHPRRKNDEHACKLTRPIDLLSAFNFQMINERVILNGKASKGCCEDERLEIMT